LVKQGYVRAEDHAEIVRQKENRADFDQQSLAEIKHYCGLELGALSKALTVLRDGFDKMDNLRLRSWTGAGSPAAALIRREELKKNHYSPDIAVQSADATVQQKQAFRAYVGGRIEGIQQGNALDRDLFIYDVVSAYPNAMLYLPSMRDGEWRFHGKMEGAKEIEVEAKRANILSMFRIKWNFPFPYRTPRKAILFPNEGHAWIMRDERETDNGFAVRVRAAKKQGKEEARAFRDELREADKIEDLHVAEARAGAAYFMRFRGVELQFKDEAPAHWHVFAARAGKMIAGKGGTSKARHAATPIGAMLNYAYVVALGQVTRAAIGAGFDACHGFLHSPKPGRLSLSYDLLEFHRAELTEAVFGMTGKRVWVRKDFELGATGVVRLSGATARDIAGLALRVVPASEASKSIKKLERWL
jgi:CRISPR associated protein Cas1